MTSTTAAMPSDELSPALVLFRDVQRSDPDTYDRILLEIQPYSVEAIAPILQYHINQSVRDLSLFNRCRSAIPRFLLRFVQAARRSFPTPGDAFGIHLTCRLTKNDTQETLDSKHLRYDLVTESTYSSAHSFNVDNDLAYELDIFSTQHQVFELATRRKYSTVFVQGLSIPELMRRLRDCIILERGLPMNKGRWYRDTGDLERGEAGHLKYLSVFKYVLIEDPKGYVKIIYEYLKDLEELLRRVPFNHILGLSDIRLVLKSGGIAAHFFNLLQLIRMQSCVEPDSVHETDMRTVIKYQCRTGTPLPLNRDGLAKHPDRSPLEVLSFEAPKKNLVRYCCDTLHMPRGQGVYPVRTSMDKIFFGEQFEEGTGGSMFSMVQKP